MEKLAVRPHNHHIVCMCVRGGQGRGLDAGAPHRHLLPLTLSRVCALQMTLLWPGTCNGVHHTTATHCRRVSTSSSWLGARVRQCLTLLRPPKVDGGSVRGSALPVRPPMHCTCQPVCFTAWPIVCRRPQLTPLCRKRTRVVVLVCVCRAVPCVGAVCSAFCAPLLCSQAQSCQC